MADCDHNCLITELQSNPPQYRCSKHGTVQMDDDGNVYVPRAKELKEMKEENARLKQRLDTLKSQK